MALTFAEGLIDEVRAYLITNLPAKLDSIDTQINDGITLLDPTSYFYRDPGISGIPTGNLPVAFLIVPDGEVVSWHESDIEQEHILWIYILARDTDADNLRKRMYRYGRAIWEVLVDHQFDATPATWKMGIGARPRWSYSPTLTRGNISLADVRLELRYHKLETE